MTQYNEATVRVSLPVAFFALIDHSSACELAIKKIHEIESSDGSVSLAGASDLRFFRQRVAGNEVLVAIFDLSAPAYSIHPEVAWANLTESPSLEESFRSLHEALLPHPRHTGAFPWVMAETICEIRPPHAAPARVDASWHSAVTGLKVEKEAEYRLLHQNVWPGVIDAIGASNISRFDIFLIEFGENQPYLCYSFQYTGDDYAEDMKAQSDSPVNQRWWRYTDPCQQALPEASKDNPWLDMNRL